MPEKFSEKITRHSNGHEKTKNTEKPRPEKSGTLPPRQNAETIGQVTLYPLLFSVREKRNFIIGKKKTVIFRSAENDGFFQTESLL
jgi:hypothetical protein